MNSGINGPVSNLGARRVLAKEVVAVPIPGGPDRSGNKAAATVRTDVGQNVLDTRGAKCALVGTDAGFEGVRRQRLIAVLARRSEFEHSVSLLCNDNTPWNYVP